MNSKILVSLVKAFLNSGATINSLDKVAKWTPEERKNVDLFVNKFIWIGVGCFATYMLYSDRHEIIATIKRWKQKGKNSSPLPKSQDEEDVHKIQNDFGYDVEETLRVVALYGQKDAAKKLGISEPALSQRLNKIRKELGIKKE